MKRKTNILYIGEFSGLNTGYATLGRNLLSELNKNDKYNVTELACVPDPHAKIAMGDGSLRSISLVNVGDEVVTHKGNTKRVLHTYKNHFNGQLVKICRHIFGHTTLEVTDNHPLLAIKKKNAYQKGKNAYCLNKQAKPEWIMARDLQVGDFVCYGSQRQDNFINNISLLDYNIKLDNDLAFFIGWYLAEGCVLNHPTLGLNAVSLCASLKEEEHIQEIRRIAFEKFGIKANFVKREDNGVYEIRLSSRDFARFILTLGGGGSRDKFINNILWKAPREFVLRMLAAYFEGDGYIGRNSIIATTVSKRLALDITRLCLQYDLPCSCRNSKKGFHVLEVAGQHASEIAQFFKYKNKDFNQLVRTEYIQIDNLYFYHISQIQKREYEGEVYNLHVEEDESYICNNFVVHNCYYRDGDPNFAKERSQFPWNIIGNLPQNEHEEQIYRSNPLNEFSKWKFDYACLQTQADVVLSARDVWMDSHILQSPFRRLFKFVWMPTVDAISQNCEWLDFYKNSDAIFTYTKFGYDTLTKEGGGLIPLRGVTTPAVDTDIFYPVENKKAHKASLGIDPNSIILGMVARNQRRKLFPEFAESFVEFMKKTEFSDSKNVYLYWHTSHPDLGWDIAKYIKNNGLSHKVLMTYYCNNPACNHWFISLYQDVTTACPRCRSWSCTLSGSNKGIDNHALAAVYNVMDLYVQFVTNEGLGIPTMEAAACGVPICGTYYSGTQDLIDNLDGYPIQPRTTFIEAETTRILALPDIDELTNYINKFVNLPISIRTKMSKNTAQKTIQHYGGWDRMAEVWSKVIDEMPCEEPSQWMTTPIDIVNVDALQRPDIDRMSHEQFLGWALSEVLHRPEWINSYVGLKMLRDLSWGRTVVNNLGFFANDISQLGGKPSYEPCNKDRILNQIIDMRRMFNQSEQARAAYIKEGKIS